MTASKVLDMTNNDGGTPPDITPDGTDRREFLRRAAIVGAGAWAVPTLAVASPANALGATGSDQDIQGALCYFGFRRSPAAPSRTVSADFYDLLDDEPIYRNPANGVVGDAPPSPIQAAGSVYLGQQPCRA